MIIHILQHIPVEYILPTDLIDAVSWYYYGVTEYLHKQSL